MLKSSGSLRVKMLRVALPAVLALTLAATLTINERRNAALRGEARRYHEEATSLYADLAAEPLWKLDKPALKILSERLLTQSGVDAVEVLDERGRSFLLARRPDAGYDATDIVMTRELVYEGPQTPRRHIGEIRIRFGGNDAPRGSLPAFAWEFGLVMFTMLAVLLLATTLYKRLIRKPLDHLLRAIRASESGQRFVEVTVVRDDEIGEIIAAYNSMQRHLAAHTERLAQIYNLTPGLLFSIDALGRFVSVSDFLCRYLVYPRDALIGRELLELSVETQADVKSLLLCSARDGVPMQGLPLQILRGDGSAIHVLLNSFVDCGAGASVLDSICVMNDVSKQLEDQAVIAKQANFDLVTGLPNRYLLLDRLHMALSAAQRGDAHVAVVFLDLDRFKAVNDTLGHKAGDRLLLDVSKRLQDQLRSLDSIGRFGGDEFVIVLNRIQGAADVETVARRLLECVYKPFSIDGQAVFVSASIGVAMYPDDGLDADALLMNADAAMYRAKKNGRNAYCFYQSSMNVELKQRMEMERRIRNAVHEGLFLVHLQPIVALADAAIVGFEALVRMIDRGRAQMVGPGEFIPLAEDIGVINEIGFWVIERVADTLDDWPIAAGGPPYITVNVSPKQLERPGFVERVRGVLEERGVDPHRLVLEITESCVINADQRSLTVLDELRGLGCRLALDDFGTGYSSLSMLRQLPVQILKIDRSFIAGIPMQAADCELVQAIMAIARSLNLQVVAEGIETVEQAGFMRAHDAASLGQGYLFGRPAEVTQWSALPAPAADRPSLRHTALMP